MGGGGDSMEVFHRAFLPLVIGIVVAILLAFRLRETGWAVQK
nr:hypothetical protein [Acetobacter persici]